MIVNVGYIDVVCRVIELYSFVYFFYFGEKRRGFRILNFECNVV